MKTTWKILIPIFFALALLLGFVQRQHLADFAFGAKTTTQYFTDSDDKSLADYFQEGLQIRGLGSQPASTTVTFLAVGDINLSRGVATNIQKAGDANLPFLGMADILKSTDFNFANLESPLASTGNEIVGGHSLVFGAPLDYAKSLVDFKFKILNLANNHAFDLGLGGINTTRTTLDNLGIIHEGTGDNLDQAWTPAPVTVNGIKICFIGASYSSINDSGKATNNYVARTGDLDRLKSAIHNSQLSCDFTIVTMHAGVEYTRTPTDAQTTFARAAIDDGADIVIGAHPHWVQTIDQYKGKYIFYSLGNFIFDQDWSEDTSEGLTLRITLSKATQSTLQGSRKPANLDSIQLIPIIIKNTAPRAATQQETKAILSKINETQTELK